MKNKKLILILAVNSIIAVLIFIVNFLYFRSLGNIFSIITIISAFILFFPILLIKYNEYKSKKEIEDMFTVFLRDFVEAVRGGLTITQAFQFISKNDYKKLSPYVKKMAAQLDWGIPIDVVLKNFSKEVKSKVISRIVFSVIESHRFGGNLTDTFEALGGISVEIERLRAERSLYLHSQLITGYVIFFVFLGVIIGLEKFLIPTFTQSQSLGETAGIPQLSEATVESFKTIFMHLILIQGFFTGLAVGKMAEGAVVAGLKHSMIMMFIGGLVFAIFG